MKRIALLPIVVMIALSITGCSGSPLDRKYSDASFVTDAKAIKESKKLEDDDIKLLAGYIIRAKLTGEKLDGITYAEMLKKAKELQATEKAQ